MLKKHWFCFLLMMMAVLIASCLGPGHGRNLELEQASNVLQSITGKKLLGYVKKLSSENYSGRLTGTIEYKQCADWTASQFKKWGLVSGGENQIYLQTYINPHTVVFVGGGLSRHLSGRGSKKYKYGHDYYPGSASANGSITAEVVYVGFGIMAPELEYNDYAGVNVKGKIVLVEPGVPVSSTKNPDEFKEWMPYVSLRYKVKMAKAYGARGFLLNKLAVIPDVEHISRLVVSNISQAVTSEIVAGAGKKHSDILNAIRTTLKPNSFRTGQRMTLHNMTEFHRRSKGYNVMGYIQGSDPMLKDDVIIVGANLDHLGFCYDVMPGANDNASGIAVLLAVAEALSQSPVKPKRTIFFIAIGSNEQGFLGVQTYLKQPLFPLDQTKAFIGLERVGLGQKYYVTGAKEYPGLYKHLRKSNQKYSSYEMDGFRFPVSGLPASDAVFFHKKRIPALFISTAEEPVSFSGRQDTYDKVEPKIMSELVKVLYFSVLDIAGQSELNL